MTLPTGGQISINDLRNEFGQTTPADGASMAEYTRGGANVPAATLAGTGSKTTAPLTPDVGPVLIPSTTSGGIQLSQFYGTAATIFGTSGLITSTSVTQTSAANPYKEFDLPAGVRYLRFYMVGGGGGSGGNNVRIGGMGGAGQTLSGTVDTQAFGGIATARKIRVFIGGGGDGGLYANDNGSRPQTLGGNGFPLVPHTFGTWSTWMNTYAANTEMLHPVGGNSHNGNWVLTRWINFPVGGTYTFQTEVDDVATFKIDGTTVIALLTANYSSATPNSVTSTLTAGWHKLEWSFGNSSTVGGLAVRILTPSSTELWTTRYENDNVLGYPCGGNGGYAGPSGASGFGGGGGGATWFSIIAGGTEYPVAVAGGGAGGGGAGSSGYAYINGNSRTQGLDLSTPASSLHLTTGGEGEQGNDNMNNDYGNILLTGLLTTSGFPNYASDGGGGGGGGGGVRNTRIFMSGIDSNYAAQYSGMGGKRAQYDPYFQNDGDAEGGEAGRSWVNPAAAPAADLVHGISQSTSGAPLWPTLTGGVTSTTLVSSAYGLGGSRNLTAGAAGNPGNPGAAYFDWGYTDSSAAPPPMTYSPITASVFPAAITVAQDNNTTSQFYADAYGAGGRPQPEYTYAWSHDSGYPVTFSNPSSGRTLVTTPATAGAGGNGLDAVTPSGVIKCVVTDTFGGSSTVTMPWITGVHLYDGTFYYVDTSAQFNAPAPSPAPSPSPSPAPSPSPSPAPAPAPSGGGGGSGGSSQNLVQ